MIRTDYDPEANILYKRLGSDGAVNDGAKQIAPGVFLEVDPAGNVIGLEVISMRLRAAPAQAAAA